MATWRSLEDIMVNKTTGTERQIPELLIYKAEKVDLIEIESRIAATRDF